MVLLGSGGFWEMLDDARRRADCKARGSNCGTTVLHSTIQLSPGLFFARPGEEALQLLTACRLKECGGSLADKSSRKQRSTHQFLLLGRPEFRGREVGGRSTFSVAAGAAASGKLSLSSVSPALRLLETAEDCSDDVSCILPLGLGVSLKAETRRFPCGPEVALDTRSGRKSRPATAM